MHLHLLKQFSNLSANEMCARGVLFLQPSLKTAQKLRYTNVAHPDVDQRFNNTSNEQILW